MYIFEKTDDIDGKINFIKANFTGSKLEQLVDALIFADKKNLVIEDSRMIKGEKGKNKFIGIQHGNIVSAWDFMDMKNEAFLHWERNGEEFNIYNSSEDNINTLIQLCVDTPTMYFIKAISAAKKKLGQIKSQLTRFERSGKFTSSYYTLKNSFDFFQNRINIFTKKLNSL